MKLLGWEHEANYMGWPEAHVLWAFDDRGQRFVCVRIRALRGVGRWHVSVRPNPKLDGGSQTYQAKLPWVKRRAVAQLRASETALRLGAKLPEWVP